MEDTDDLDPRVQDELDLLNSSSKDINRLENEIDEARTRYRSTFQDASRKMEATGKGIKKFIQRARQYYHLKEAAVQAQSEALRAARQFQTANGVYRAAKETIALAEEKLIEDQSAAMLSSAWQEMLNHATIRVMEAEREKTRAEQEHMKRSAFFASLEGKLQFLEKKFKKSIMKARPYFEVKAELELHLQTQKQNIDDLQNAIKSAKQQYSESLRRLEGISEEIHESRRQKILLMFPREPGVGADNESLASTISDPNLDRGFSLSSPIDEHTDDTDNEDDEEEGDDVFHEGNASQIDSGDACVRSESHATNHVRMEIGSAFKTAGDSHLDRLVANDNQENVPSCDVSKENREKDISANVNTCDMVKESKNIVQDVTPVSARTAHACDSSKAGVRESGNGAEQKQICNDNDSGHSVSSSSTGSDVRLPERGDNPTEGASDPEELARDLKKSVIVSDLRDDIAESTAIM